jgi:hypothetical protein
MTAGPRRRARALAIVAAVLITVAGLFVWFTVDTRLPRVTATFYASAILLLTVPLLFSAGVAHATGEQRPATITDPALLLARCE